MEGLAKIRQLVENEFQQEEAGTHRDRNFF